MTPGNLPNDYYGLELDFHALANHIPQLAWMAERDGVIFWYNQPWYDYTGTTPAQAATAGWVTLQHPHHRERVLQGYASSVEAGEPFEDTAPLQRHDGEWCWFLTRTRPIRDQDGRIVRWFGTSTDITEQKETEARQRHLMREIDHRAKNALAVAQAVVKLSEGVTIGEYRQAVESRVAALSRAHSLLADNLWQDVDIRQIINGEVEARRGLNGKITLHGDCTTVGPSLAQPVTIVINELLTNAERHGALAMDKGDLAVSWETSPDDVVTIEWRESNARKRRPDHVHGVGSTIMERIISQQLHGSIERRWKADGVTYAIRFPSAQSE